MPLGPASGLCCGYTMTRAILADAIALIRGDRFYTTDYTREHHSGTRYQLSLLITTMYSQRRT